MPLPEIRLSSLAYTMGHWLPETCGGHDPFDLEAPYQRGSVWTVDQQQALIKSLYMGLPIGSIIISVLPYARDTEEDEPKSWRVVDGKQRIEAIRAWAGNRLTCPKWWFRDEDLSPEAEPYVTVLWHHLSDRGQRHFDMSTTVSALEFNGQIEWLGPNPKGKGWLTRTRTPQEILVCEAELYGLINGAGTVQTEQDMARAAAIAGGTE